MKDFRSCMKALRAMGKPVRVRMAVTVLIGLVRIAASLGFVWASKFLVDIATGVQKADITTGILIFLGILLLQLGAIILNNWWLSYSQVKSQNILRQDIFAHVMKSRWDGRDRFLSGDAVNRLEEDTRVVAELLTDRLPGMAITAIQLIAASVYLTLLAPNLLWVLLILMVSTVFGSKLFFKQLRRLMASIRARESELQQLMQESLQHRVLVAGRRRIGHPQAPQLQCGSPRPHVLRLPGRTRRRLPVGRLRHYARDRHVRYDDCLPSISRPGPAAHC